MTSTDPTDAPTPRALQHTPGPWLREGAACVYALNASGTNRFLAQLQAGYRYQSKSSRVGSFRTTDSELEANGRLMAAAPDLLAALTEAERFLDYFTEGRTFFPGGGTPKTCLAGIRAAIAKATTG